MAEPLMARLEGKLMRWDAAAGELVDFEFGESRPEYYLIYFSAHWCAPCRKRTPALAEFYRETKATHPGFEFVLVSGDRTEAGMERYFEWGEMPWPALAWSERDSVPQIADLAPRAIPFMALLDAKGNTLVASDLGGYNVGIAKVLNVFQERIGSEVYDVEARHGKSLPLWVMLLLAVGVVVVIGVLRRKQRGAESPASSG